MNALCSVFRAATGHGLVFVCPYRCTLFLQESHSVCWFNLGGGQRWVKSSLFAFEVDFMFPGVRLSGADFYIKSWTRWFSWVPSSVGCSVLCCPMCHFSCAEMVGFPNRHRRAWYAQEFLMWVSKYFGQKCLKFNGLRKMRFLLQLCIVSSVFPAVL